MSDNTQQLDRAERIDQAWTVASGWGAIVLFVLGLHRWVATGFDWWTRFAVIFAAACAVMWVWGYWAQIVARLSAWKRNGGLNSTVIAVGLIIALVLVNTLVRRRVHLQVDLTQNKRYTLAPRTKEILRSLEEPVKATVFLPTGSTNARGLDLFQQYATASDKFRWTQIDPLKNPDKLLGINPPPKLNQATFSGAILEYQGKRQDVTEFTEKDLTSAILKMTRDRQRKILFVTGHGEPNPGPAVGSANPAESIQFVTQDLRDADWLIETVDLYRKDAQTPDPEEVAVLVIAGPEKPLAEQELKHVEEYLNKGGKVLLMLNPQGPTFSDFLKKWGIQTSNDLVRDPSQQGLVLVAADQSAHESVRTAVRVLFPPLRSVTSAPSAPTGVTVTELLRSGPFSEVISDFKPGMQLSAASGKPGPVAIAALAEKTIGSGEDEKKARLLVVGDYQFMSDQIVQLPSFYNLDVASGLVNYLGEEEALVQIAPKDENTEQAFLTPTQEKLLPLIHLVDFPLLALLLAVVVYLKRR